MSGQPDRLKDVSAWIRIAEDDFKTAESLLLMDDPAFGIICFHAQQCAEKYLKALLVWLQIDIPKTHDLTLLARLMPEDVVLSMDAAQWAFLN
jgi:HEPN domain-containing protein